MSDRLSVSTLQELILKQDHAKNTIIIVKFSAEWCRPCQTIAPYCADALTHLPHNVRIFELDIDESLDVFAFLKNKKMLKGVPAILSWQPSTTRENNLWYIPDDSVLSSDMSQVKSFFSRCNVRAKHAFLIG